MTTAPQLLGEFDFDLVPDARYGAAKFGSALRIYGRYFDDELEIERITLAIGDEEADIEPSDELWDWIQRMLAE